MRRQIDPRIIAAIDERDRELITAVLDVLEKNWPIRRGILHEVAQLSGDDPMAVRLRQLRARLHDDEPLIILGPDG
jgi:hypothetical protein